MRRPRAWLTHVILLGVVLLTAACSGGGVKVGPSEQGSSGQGPSGQRQSQARAPSSTRSSSPSGSDVYSTNPGQPGTYSSTGSSVADGEIWQWAIGRNMHDPALRQYMQDLGQDYMCGGAMVKSRGFELNIDSSGTVHSVTLFNDENRLGFSENTFRAYRGALPAGLSWSETASDIVNSLGQPDAAYTAGWGIESYFTYNNLEGYTLRINLAARHQQDVPNSPMQSIEVSPT